MANFKVDSSLRPIKSSMSHAISSDFPVKNAYQIIVVGMGSFTASRTTRAASGPPAIHCLTWPADISLCTRRRRSSGRFLSYRLADWAGVCRSIGSVAACHSCWPRRLWHDGGFRGAVRVAAGVYQGAIKLTRRRATRPALTSSDGLAQAPIFSAVSPRSWRWERMIRKSRCMEAGSRTRQRYKSRPFRGCSRR